MPRPVACNPGWGCEKGNGGGNELASVVGLES